MQKVETYDEHLKWSSRKKVHPYERCEEDCGKCVHRENCDLCV